MQYTQYTVNSTQVYRRQCTVYSAQYTVNSAQYTVHSIQNAVYRTQYTVYNTHYTVRTIQCTLYSKQITVYIIHSIFNIAKSVSTTGILVLLRIKCSRIYKISKSNGREFRPPRGTLFEII